MNTTTTTILWLFVCASLTTWVDGSLFYVNGTLFKDVNSPSVRIGDHFNITAKIVLADPEDACHELKNPDSELEGNIIWFSPSKKAVPCRLEDRIRNAEKRGVKGIVYGFNGYGAGYGWLGYFLRYNIEHSKTSVPIVEVNWFDNKDIHRMLKDKSNDVTTVIFDGTNDLTDTANIWTAFSVIVGIHTFVCLVVAGLKWRLFLVETGFHLNVPQGCLLLNMTSCLFRLFMMIDPPYTRGIYPFQVTAVFDILNYPLVLCGTLLMSFYWEEAMRVAKVHSIPTLRKMKVPFWISASVMMFLAFIAVVFRSLNAFLGAVTIINGCITLGFSIPITIFYSVQATKILSRLFKSTSVHMRARQFALYKMTLFLVGSTFSMVCYLVIAVLFVSLPYNINLYITLRWLVGITINFLCLLQAMAFQKPNSLKHSSVVDPDKRTSGANAGAPKEDDTHRKEDENTIELP